MICDTQIIDLRDSRKDGVRNVHVQSVTSIVCRNTDMLLSIKPVQKLEELCCIMAGGRVKMDVQVTKNKIFAETGQNVESRLENSEIKFGFG